MSNINRTAYDGCPVKLCLSCYATLGRLRKKATPTLHFGLSKCHSGQNTVYPNTIYNGVLTLANYFFLNYVAISTQACSSLSRK